MRNCALLALIALLPPFLSAARVSLRDGTIVNGQFISGNTQEIIFQDDNGVRRRFSLNQVLNIDFSSISDTVNRNAGANRMVEHRGGNDAFVLPAETSISVRTEQAIGPENAADGSTFSAVIVQDVLDATGNVAIPRGSEATLVVRRLTGSYALDLASVRARGRRYTVNTAGAGGSGLGTLFGAITGGGVQVSTKGKEIRVPAETVLNFRLDEPLRLRED